METKRYAVELDMYIYAANDKEAKQFLNGIVSFLNRELDNHTRAKKMVEIPFGSLRSREITDIDTSLEKALEEDRIEFDTGLKKFINELG